jgi:hypothetical protein
MGRMSELSARLDEAGLHIEEREENGEKVFLCYSEPDDATFALPGAGCSVEAALMALGDKKTGGLARGDDNPGLRR